MILLDPRAGSKDLLEPMQKAGLPVELSTLEFGDVAFGGNGPDGPVVIGVEYKHMGDAINCMVTGRFAGHQLIGMSDYHDYWLLIDGLSRYRVGDEGQLQTISGSRWYDVTQGSRAITSLAYSHWLLSMQNIGGCKVWQCEGQRESVEWIASLYSWWNKNWSEHKSVGVYHKPPERNKLMKPTLSRLWAAQLPGIGYDKSVKVAEALPRAFDIAIANEDVWTSIEGIGKLGARKIMAAIKQENYSG